jgi:hypothetical protein
MPAAINCSRSAMELKYVVVVTREPFGVASKAKTMRSMPSPGPVASAGVAVDSC